MGSSICYIWDHYDDYDDYDNDDLQVLYTQPEFYDPCGHMRLSVVEFWEEVTSRMLKWGLHYRKFVFPVIHDRVVFRQHYKQFHQKHYCIENLMRDFPHYTEETVTDYYDLYHSHFDIKQTGLSSIKSMCRAFRLLGDVSPIALRITVMLCLYDGCRYYHLYKFIRLITFLEEQVGKESSLFQSVRRGVKWMHMAYACTPAQYWLMTRGS